MSGLTSAKGLFALAALLGFSISPFENVLAQDLAPVRATIEIRAMSPSVAPGVQPFFDPQDEVAELKQATELAPIWRATTNPLRGSITKLHVYMKSSEIIRPVVTLALPYQRGTYSLRLPSEAHTPRYFEIERIYDNLEAVGSTDAWFPIFVEAELLISNYQGDRPPHLVTPNGTLEKALVVYASAVQALLKTDWFGRPLNLQSRIEMLERINQRPFGNANLSKLSLVHLTDAQHILRGREWNGMRRMWVEHSDAACLDLFPMAMGFYKELRNLPEDEYKRHKEVNSLDRDLVLSLATACFRRLVARGSEAAYTDPRVEDSAFAGRSASGMLGYLIGAHRYELGTYANQTKDITCAGPADYRRGRAYQLACDLAYLKETEGLLEPARPLSEIVAALGAEP